MGLDDFIRGSIIKKLLKLIAEAVGLGGKPLTNAFARYEKEVEDDGKFTKAEALELVGHFLIDLAGEMGEEVDG